MHGDETTNVFYKPYSYIPVENVVCTLFEAHYTPISQAEIEQRVKPRTYRDTLVIHLDNPFAKINTNCGFRLSRTSTYSNYLEDTLLTL